MCKTIYIGAVKNSTHYFDLYRYSCRRSRQKSVRNVKISIFLLTLKVVIGIIDRQSCAIYDYVFR